MLSTSGRFLLVGLMVGVVFGAGEVPASDYAVDTAGNTGQAAYDNVVATYPSGVLLPWTNFDMPYGMGDFEYIHYYEVQGKDCTQFNCVNPRFVQVRIAGSTNSFKEMYDEECLDIDVALNSTLRGARCKKDNMRSNMVSQECKTKCTDYGVTNCNDCLDLEVRFYCESEEECTASARRRRREMRDLEEADIQVTREIQRGLEAEKKKVDSVNKVAKQKRLLELLSDLLSNNQK